MELLSILWADHEMNIWTVATYITLNLVLAISIYTDARHKKIYNKVTYPAIVLGFVFNTLAYGYDGFISCIISMAGALLFYLLFYAVGMIGAGDVKLIVAVATLMNIFYALAGLIVGSFLAAIYGAFIWLRTKNRKARIPYGVFIGVGFYIYQVLCLVI